MVLSVMTNIASLNAQLNLQKSQNGLNQSLERLSSGLRINSAADDAAGLAISNGLQSQINGLDQAVRNANDGLNMMGTAESAINSYTSILQSIRTLAVQSANDTNSSTNRQEINQESSQLLQELQRISTTVQFNGTNLIDGSFNNKQLQVGANANQTIHLSIGDMRTSQLGQVAQAIGTAVPATSALSAGDLLINGVDVSPSLADGVSYSNSSSSAIAMANAINLDTSETGVTAAANAAVLTGAGTIAGATYDPATMQLKINGISIFTSTTTVAANDASSTLRNAINAQTNVTGVTASLNANNKLVLTAADGRNITVQTTGNLGGASLGIAGDLGLQVADGNMDNSAAPTGGTVTLTSDNDIVVSGTNTNYAGLSTQTYTLDPTTAIDTVDLSTAAGANLAIQQVDNALSQVDTQLANLGAVENRLQDTISNLQGIAQNLTASNSSIQDADFAAETSNMTKNNILQQAGISVLAQANTTAQNVLKLLQG